MEIPSSTKPLGAGPKTRVCYICGRQYGLNSYEIHLKQCKELFIAREAQKDPKERKALPEDPMIKLMNKSKGGAAETPTKQGTGTANNTFSPSATMEGGLSLEEINKMASESFNTETLSTCAFCGRTFLPEKLAIHNKSCTADNPARKVTDNVRRGNPNPIITEAGPRPSTSSASANPRPSTTQNIKSRLASTTPVSDGSSLDDIQSPLAGSMGSTAGREVRKAAPRPAVTASASTASSKDEIIEELKGRIDKLELTANEMLQSAADMRALISKLV